MTPLLYLPGTLCDERVWLPVWQHMQPHQRRYVPLQWATSYKDMMALTGDRVLEDEKVHLIGFSMGGYIAAQWAINNPQHVASLTLIGFAPRGLTPREVKRRQLLVTQIQQGKYQASNHDYLKNMLKDSATPDPELFQQLCDMTDDLGPATLLAHTQSTTPREDVTQGLKAINDKLHFVGAEFDTIAPVSALMQAHQSLPGSTFTLVSDAGHMMALEQPKALASALMKFTM